MTRNITNKDHSVNSAVRTLYGFAKAGYVNPIAPSPLIAFTVQKVNSCGLGFKQNIAQRK